MVAAFARLLEYLLDEMPYPQAALVFLAQNALVFASAIGVGALAVRLFHRQRVAPPPPPLERLEIGLAATTVVLNAAVTLAGLVLYRLGIVRLRVAVDARVLLDVVVLSLVMDAAMYFLHRLAHVEPLFRLLHAPHHRYDRPRPLTLFVLHPFETLAFGGLWLAVISIYPASWLGIAIYLTLNLAFGLVGHLGVEPAPRFFARTPGLREVATARFHAEHHADPHHNFGFYTLLWDRLFDTLPPLRK